MPIVIKLTPVVILFIESAGSILTYISKKFLIHSVGYSDISIWLLVLVNFTVVLDNFGVGTSTIQFL